MDLTTQIRENYPKGTEINLLGNNTMIDKHIAAIAFDENNEIVDLLHNESTAVTALHWDDVNYVVALDTEATDNDPDSLQEKINYEVRLINDNEGEEIVKEVEVL
mgnify:FL=1